MQNYTFIKSWSNIQLQQRWLRTNEGTFTIVSKFEIVNGKKIEKRAPLLDAFDTTHVTLKSVFAQTTEISSECRHDLKALQCRVSEKYVNYEIHRSVLRRILDAIAYKLCSKMSVEHSYNQLYDELQRIIEIQQKHSCNDSNDKELFVHKDQCLEPIDLHLGEEALLIDEDPPVFPVIEEEIMDKGVRVEAKKNLGLEELVNTEKNWKSFLTKDPLPEKETIYVHFTKNPKTSLNKHLGPVLNDLRMKKDIELHVISMQDGNIHPILLNEFEIERRLCVFQSNAKTQTKDRVQADAFHPILTQHTCHEENISVSLVNFVKRCLDQNQKVHIMCDKKILSLSAYNRLLSWATENALLTLDIVDSIA